MSSYFEKLTLLRNYLHKNDIEIYIIPSTDPHIGENIPDHWRIIEWLTGFTGSSATTVITDSFAGLWTDSRYFIQADKQLSGSGFHLVKPGIFQRHDYMDFIFENSRQQTRIGVDGRIFSISNFKTLKERLADKQTELVADCDLIDSLWSDRPPMPLSVAFDHPVEFAGKDRSVKIEEVRKLMQQQNTDFHLLTSPDDIMWLLNIRGNDLKYSPLLLSFALICPDQILLFIDESKIPVKLASEFDKTGVVILPYQETVEIVSSVTNGSTVLLNPQTTSVTLYNSISKNSKIIEGISIPARSKVIKNKTEIENICDVMLKDGLALTRLFYWFYNNHGKQSLAENSLSDRLLELRLLEKDFLGSSFATIAAFNENSALPHYHAGAGPGSEIGERGLILIDSGGQYMGGTTDITRTIPVGIPSSQQKKDFTLVLKGHINLAMAKFPAGTHGYQIDILARKVLWDFGLNYGHGTGHGVGFCLNVHEGPQSISPSANKTILESGMLMSNEPALYREGEYGIRIENLILCYEDEETEYGQFLRFDTLSLCYIERSLIDKSLLDQKEIEWLNSYHSEVYEKLSQFLTPEEKQWLKEKTEAI